MQRGRQRNEILLLSERYVVLLLIEILNAGGPVKLNGLSNIVTSFRTLDALTDRMAEEGIITKKLEQCNYVTTFLELTSKGRLVAEKLNEAVNIFQNQ